MATSIVDADTLLAIDLGTVTTRAFFFDTVAGAYRFVAMGSSPSTFGPPINNGSEGVRRAIDRLQQVAGRQLVSLEEDLITPSNSEGAGVDTVVATVSAVPPLKVLTLGLMEDVSLESANNLASTIYSRIVDSISMNDKRSLATKIDEILHQRPDLVIVAGGTENGASKSVIKLLDPVGLAAFLMPQSQRPTVLFAGNPSVAREVRDTLKDFTTVHLAHNLRPTLESEQLGPAQGELRAIFRRVFSLQDEGVQELDAWSAGRLLPNATGFGRMIRFISQHEPSKGVLGVDLGASSIVVAAAVRGDLRQRIYSGLGIGESLESLLRYTNLTNIAGWLATNTSEADIRDYVLHKTLYPNSVPETEEEAAIELALARELLRTAMRDARRYFPPDVPEIVTGQLPNFEPIVISGSTLTNTARHGHSLLAVLDALEPVGVSVLLSDENGLMASLGAAAEVNPVLPVQVLDSGVLKSWGTLIAPVGNARFGTPILRVRVALPSGEEKRLDIKEGMLTTIPLESGQKARVHLQPLRGYHVGLGGMGRGGSINVVGGELGIVIDARGRPLRFSPDASRRKDLIKKWLWILSH